MEDLADGLAGGLVVVEAVNDTALPHPRFDQYKSRVHRSSDQESRRRERLRRQKEQRQGILDAHRDVPAAGDDDCRAAEGQHGDSDESMAKEESQVSASACHSATAEAGNDEASMDVEDMADGSSSRRRGRKSKQKHLTQVSYRKQLMMSEWLVDVPDDFASKWLMKICPVGKRCLVVAGRGMTSAYSNNGHRINTFHSLLPGGAKKSPSHDAECTLLDCIYVESQCLYCVLDVLCWNSSDMLEVEADCRFFWLKSRIDENPGVQSVSKLNPYAFKTIAALDCQSTTLQSVFSSAPDVQVDGVLFYHRESGYEHGRTPLLGWLRCSMLAEIIGVAASEAFLAQCIGDESCIPFGKFRAAKDQTMEVT
ncbi:snurportin-1-like isoform X1 [Sycon ciliatum]|uniref:snurportin-1-like isoform X1 n=1 Tax=Sycon ciliatum TaxID=27933 RepID=UPI0031F6E56D